MSVLDRRMAGAAVAQNLNAAGELLARLIEFPSTRGNEREVGVFLGERIAPFADRTELVAVPDTLQDDPDYSFRLPGFHYAGAANVRARLLGARGGRSLAFNTHLDVVPATAGDEAAFRPRIEGGGVFGRGACDAKGQIATLWLMAKTLRDLGLRPGGDVTIDFVVEEECGGNGALLVVRNGLRADAAVVLEPTELQVVHLVRGAVWFTVETRGRAGHSGSPGTTVSALKEAVRAMAAIEAVREECLAVSRRELAKIAGHPNPMPCTFGMLHAGNWPAAAPAEAVLKGVFGFLPPFGREEIQARLRAAAAPLPAEIKFDMLNSNPSFIPEDHALTQGLLRAARAAGPDARAEFMNASCDAWRYSHQLGIPAVVFGPGSISTAHGARETIALDDIGRAATALLYFLDDWSGVDHV
jgi:acetylornithine deacetylase